MNSGIEIIHHLRHQAGPVDRIDGGQAEAPREIAVVEHPLHESLSIIEATVDSNIMDIVRAHGGHLSTLHVRYASIRMKHEDIDLLTTRHVIDGGRSGRSEEHTSELQSLMRISSAVL